MSKKKEKKKGKTPSGKKRKTLKSWGFSESQKSVIAQMYAIHKRELSPLLRYQEKQTQQVLLEIKKEIGIPDNVDVEFIAKNMLFVEILRQSDTTKDLSKLLTASALKKMNSKLKNLKK